MSCRALRAHDDGVPGSNALLKVKGAARTLTTLVIAVTATVVLTLAGCAGSDGFASSGRLAEPGKAGVWLTPGVPTTGGGVSGERRSGSGR